MVQITRPKVGTESSTIKKESYGAINVFRITLFFCFVATTVVGGYFAYSVLASYEFKAAMISFDATTDHMESYSQTSFHSKMSAVRTIHTYLKTQCPTPAYWPFCTANIDDYDTISTALVSMADIAKFNHESNVFPDEIDDFVTSAVNFYNTSGYPDVAAKVAEMGIFGTDDDGSLYGVTESAVGDNYLIAVILQISYPLINCGALMFNIYSGTPRISTIDRILACVKQYDGVDTYLSVLEIVSACTVTTSIIRLVEDPTFRPASILMSPVLLAIDPSAEAGLSEDRRNKTVIVHKDAETLLHVGSTSAVFHWDEMLSRAVFPSTNGLEVVLSDGISSHVFTYKDGAAIYVKEVDSRRAKDRSRYQKAFPIIFLENSDLSFTLTVTMDDTFTKAHQTNAPVIGCIITVAVVVVSFFQFVIYDFLVAKKSAEQEQAKKKYVGYISHGMCFRHLPLWSFAACRLRSVFFSACLHIRLFFVAYSCHISDAILVLIVCTIEIRTPLTTVSLGVKFVQRELKELLRMRNWQKQQVSSTPTSTEAISAGFATAGPDSDHLVAERRACCCNSSDDAKLLDMVGMLSSVESSTGTAIRILNDLLNYDKIKSTGLRLDPEVFDPWDMMEAVTAGFQVQAREKGVCLRLAVERRKSLRPTLVASSHMFGHHDYSTVSSAAREDPQELMTSLVVNGDRLKLEQVARNLISNALKFTPTGRKITVTCKQIPLLSLSISISLSVSY
jgi:hypothetical protein